METILIKDFRIAESQNILMHITLLELRLQSVGSFERFIDITCCFDLPYLPVLAECKPRKGKDGIESVSSKVE